MGQECSIPSDTHFNEEEIRRLHKRFHKLDTDNSSTLSTDELMSIPGLEGNPLVRRVIDIFDTDGNGEIDFCEFLQGISQFTAKEEVERKMKFIFQVYDINNDGFISNGELFTVLKLMIGKNLDDLQLQNIVDKTIARFDSDGDGRISYDEFCYAVGNLDVYKKMNVEV